MMPIHRLCMALSVMLLGTVTLTITPAAAQDAKAQWSSSLKLCSAENRGACDQAVTLAATLFERTSRDVAITWMQVCIAGDVDRCEIGYRRFKRTSFPDDPKPISHMFARASCFGGIADLCRPWDDFETADQSKRAVVMADVCMQGGLPNTCYTALAHFRNKKGLYNAITYDLSNILCERYKSGSACRVWAEALEANWDHRRAYKFHDLSCRNGLKESCPDATRLKKRVDYENRQREIAAEVERRRAAAVQQNTTWRQRLRGNGYTSPGYMRTPTTPFGSSSRDVTNWNRYQKNLCLGNPVNKYC